MFVDTEVEKKRAQSRGDGDDDDNIKIVEILIKKGQLSPVNSPVHLNLRTQVTEDHDDEESCCVKTSNPIGRPFSKVVSLSCVPKIGDGEERRKGAFHDVSLYKTSPRKLLFR